MQENNINYLQSNLKKSYILKVENQLEKYIARNEEGDLFPTVLIKASVFDDKSEAEKIANQLSSDNQQIQVLEIQDRSMW